MWGDDKKDFPISKDEMRIQLKRENNEKRRLRFLDARKRVIGLDVDALDAQVAEKMRSKSDYKEADRMERLRMHEIERVLQMATEEEKQMKDFQNQEFKKSWDAAITSKKNKVPEQDYNPEASGASAAQIFAGEDRNRVERISQQKDQMRRWVQEKTAEKAFSNAKDSQENMDYAVMMKAIDEIRGNAEREEIEIRQYIKQSANQQNAELAALLKARKVKELEEMRSASCAAATSLNMHDETATAAMNEQGKIVRTDMFKGFTDAQRRRILQENEVVLRDKRLAKDEREKEGHEWAMQQSLANRAMEMANYEENCMRESQKVHQLSVLKQQREEQRQAREQWDKQRSGAIDSSFYESFGKSCR